MKKVVSALLCGTWCLCVGCGRDGDDGDAYIALNWVYAPNYYWDNNPAIPIVFYRGAYYRSSPGAYDFGYEAYEGSQWVGTYTIAIDKGEDGGLFTDGDDGRDRYFTLWLYSSGPSLNEDYARMERAPAATGAVEELARRELTKADQSTARPGTPPIGELQVEETWLGSCYLRLEYRRIR